MKIQSKGRAPASPPKLPRLPESSPAPTPPAIDPSLLTDCRPGWSLPGRFYRDAAVYEADLDRIWRKGWLFAGHSCEISRPGEFFTLEIGPDSLIVMRDQSGQAHCLYNVCRHRGSLICTEPAGKVSRLVCPYHQWSYGLDGRLLGCRGMQPDLDKSQFSLGRAHLSEIEGLIFISLAAEPAPIANALRELGPLLKPQGFASAKIAAVADYRVAANWKLVWENNRECYHCNVNHPQYIKANFDHYNADDTTPQVAKDISRIIEEGEEKWARDGLAPTHKQAGMTVFPDAENNVWFSANRTPLVDGWVTESMDGTRVGPLMGDYRDADVGTLRIRTLPNFWNHSSCDHGVSTRLLPAGPEGTAIRVYWLVDQDAVEGKDYELSRLKPFWQLTSEQDWQICERQQKGVRSSAYRPGPYSSFKEYNVDSFVRWYLKMVTR